MKFPKVVYVRIEKDNDGEILLAARSPDGENGEKVAVYQLVEVKTQKITQELV